MDTAAPRARLTRTNQAKGPHRPPRCAEGWEHYAGAPLRGRRRGGRIAVLQSRPSSAVRGGVNLNLSLSHSGPRRVAFGAPLSPPRSVLEVPTGVEFCTGRGVDLPTAALHLMEVVLPHQHHAFSNRNTHHQHSTNFHKR